MATFEKIHPHPVQATIASQLRAAILSGQLELGAHLPETDLAAQMAVSRIPVREALRLLEQEGLVTRRPNHGCFVISFMAQDVREVFSLRAHLENMALAWAAPHLTAVDFAGLRALVAEQEAVIAAGDYERLAALDMRFHHTICLRAGHARLLKAWGEQHTQCQILLNRRFRRLPAAAPGTVLTDHTAILAALEARDVAAAQRLTDEISQRVAEECIATLEE
jgi:DNA-binding GntR family transcriptional regulator